MHCKCLYSGQRCIANAYIRGCRIANPTERQNGRLLIKKNKKTMESKRIVCPGCHGTLEVTNPKGEPVLMIKCPNPACGAKLRVRFDTGETVIAPKKTAATVPGYLTWDGQSFELKEGRNSVGRSSSKHEADIELPTEDRSVSRLHCLLDARRLNSGRVKVVISDLRTAEKISQKPTLIYDESLAPEDMLVLEDGDTIEIGDQTLRFHQKTLEP